MHSAAEAHGIEAEPAAGAAAELRLADQQSEAEAAYLTAEAAR